MKNKIKHIIAFLIIFTCSLATSCNNIPEAKQFKAKECYKKYHRNDDSLKVCYDMEDHERAEAELENISSTRLGVATVIILAIGVSIFVVSLFIQER